MDETPEASRKLDALIAEQVMGWKDVTPRRSADGSWSGKCPRPDGGFYVDDLPPYSSDIAAAWLIVDALHTRGECLTLIWLETLDGARWGLRWQAEFRMSGSYGLAKTAPLAICRAALVAVARITPVPA